MTRNWRGPKHGYAVSDSSPYPLLIQGLARMMSYVNQDDEMKRNNANWVRLFLLGMMALILTLAAFGGGMVVGADLSSADARDRQLARRCRVF